MKPIALKKEQVNVEIVGNKEAPHKAIKNLAIGEVRPVEVQDEDEDTVVHADYDPTTHHVSSNEHGEAFAIRRNHDGRPNDAQGHSHLNSTIKKEVKSTLHKTIVLILQSIKTMMMKMMVPSKDQLKCHIQEYINPFNGIIPLITYWGAFDEE
jgi:hypothetical protein